jgi:cytochrome c peroxidase
MKNSTTSRKDFGFQPAIIVVLILVWIGLAAACQKDENVQQSSLTPYVIEEPADFPEMEIPDDNRLYVERIALGRKLYYDPLLSNNGRSCSSCHLQKKGFTAELPQDMPVLPHVNMAWKNNWMWNGSKKGTLEEVMLFEVEEFFATDISKLNKHEEYPALFKEAYGVDQISSLEVAKALAQFARTMISADSKYDRVQRGLAQFTPDEAKGYLIFNSEKSSCYHCHTPPLFHDDGLHNNGLDSTYENSANQGHFAVTGDSSHLGLFRTPTLRNLSLRESYMHDGRYKTIREVVEQYNKGVKRSPTLDPTMIKQGGRMTLNLSDVEVDQLVAFLYTLTDSTYVNDPALSNPE